MTKERTIKLLKSKLRIYRISYDKAVAAKNFDSASKWRVGHNRVVREINRLTEGLKA
jgi:hypothetical protein